MKRRAENTMLVRTAATAAILAFGANSAHAGLILSPLGGVTIFSSGDDNTTHLSLKSSYQFFGQSFNGVDVSTNGNLNFDGSASPFDTSFPNSGAGAMIAPMWDDFTLFGNSRIIEQQGNGFFAVTWKSMAPFSNTTGRDTFQAIVFDKARNFGGFNFQAGDIAFAYGPLGPDLSFDGDTTVGLNKGDGTHGAGLPGSGQTVLTSADLSLLDPVKHDFILFRFNGTGYDSSYQHTDRAVPEPSSFVAFGMGLLGLGQVARFRRKSRRNAR